MTATKRAAAVLTGLALTVMSMSGCQWLAENAPGMPTPDPKPSVTPVETAQERQMRLDQEAAVKAYLTSSKEFDRLLMSGGATKPTKVILSTTGGSHLEALTSALEVVHDNGWRTDRPASRIVNANGGWSPSELGLTACEDTSKVKFLGSKGKEVFKDRERRYVHTLTATKKDGAWKITNGESKAVKSFETEGSCAT